MKKITILLQLRKELVNFVVVNLHVFACKFEMNEWRDVFLPDPASSNKKLKYTIAHTPNVSPEVNAYKLPMSKFQNNS